MSTHLPPPPLSLWFTAVIFSCKEDPAGLCLPSPAPSPTLPSILLRTPCTRSELIVSVGVTSRGCTFCHSYAYLPYIYNIYVLVYVHTYCIYYHKQNDPKNTVPAMWGSVRGMIRCTRIDLHAHPCKPPKTHQFTGNVSKAQTKLPFSRTARWGGRVQARKSTSLFIDLSYS